jgi:8-amino-7-oxononanoate synthase
MLKKVYKEKILSKNKKCLRKLPNSKQKVNLDFSNNDYLGLSKNQIILSGAIKAAHEYGIGSTGSRLLSGNNELFMQFESEIANCKNTESALIFNSGFQCNAFVLASLLDNKTLKSQSLVFFDRLNHSSLYQAAFLSGAKLIRYRHNDWQHLSNLISDYSHDKRPKFIVTETVFGMDGDICPLKEIISIAKESDALLYLDEAHATGIIGKNGYGLSTEFDLNDITAVVMGTFSKALGASGAYIACDSTIKDYIINFCHGFIYSTAPSPFVIGAAQAGWQMLPGLEADRKTLKTNSDYLREKIKMIGLDVGHSTTNIVPIILGDEALTKYIYQELLAYNIKVSSILPPTVPPGTARIRIALNINHSKQDIEQLIEALKCIKK